MPLALIFIGLIMVVIAFRGTEREFATQLKTDFGGGEFIAWFGAIAILGGIGLVPQLRTLSNLAMALVIVVLVIKNGGLFANLASVIEHPPTPSAPVPLSTYYSGGGTSVASLAGGVQTAGDFVSDLTDFG